MDVIASAIGLAVLAPLFAFIAWAIKRDSPGPVFFRGPRAARGGGVFKILKFRTMYERPESYAGLKITAKDDPRITPVGKWLRNTKLNELPQLWNVLKGEMSLVGPRPEDPDIVAEWPDEIRREILSVRPGITSPATVMYRDEENLLRSHRVMEYYLHEIVPDKQRLDQLYVRNHSLLLDLDVLFWTILVLMPRLGEYRPPETVLFWGPLSRFIGRYLNWFVVDALVAFVAVSLTGLFWRFFGPLNVGWETAVLSASVFSMLFSVSGGLFGIQRIVWTRARGDDAVELIPPAILATLLAFGLNFLLLADHRFPLPLVALASGLSFLGFVLVRYRSRLVRSFLERFLKRRDLTRTTRERVLIIGGGTAGEVAAHLLRQPLRDMATCEVVGFVDDDLYKQGVHIAGLPVLGTCRQLPQLAMEHDVGLVVFAIHNITPQKRDALLRICAQANTRVFFFPNFWRALSAALDANGIADALPMDNGSLASGWVGLPPAHIANWLDELAEVLERGDLSEAQAKVAEMRRALTLAPVERKAVETQRP